MAMPEISDNSFSNTSKNQPVRSTMGDVFNRMDNYIVDAGDGRRSLRMDTFPGGYAVVDRTVEEDGGVRYKVDITRNGGHSSFLVVETNNVWNEPTSDPETERVVNLFGKLFQKKTE